MVEAPALGAKSTKRGAAGAAGAAAAGMAGDGLERLRESYRTIGMPMRTYALHYLGPTAAAGVGATVVTHGVLVPRLNPLLGAPLGVLVPLLFALIAAFLPLLLRERRRTRSDNVIHFYITRAGVLASSNLGALEVLRRLTDKDAFGPLGEDTQRIIFLVTRWNMNLSEACRSVASHTPSRIFGEFLERFASALDSGEDLAAFLDSEQRVVMEDFATVYQGALYSIESLQEAFHSLAMALVFLAVFGMVSPVLTGFSAEVFLLYALVAMGVVDSVFLVLIKAKAPNDPIWHGFTGKTPREHILRTALPASAAVGAVLALALLVTSALPTNLVLVVAMTPVVGAGVLLRREEAAVRSRDENYPAFIRALGSATSASGDVVRQVLARLRHQNFGPLNRPVERLYRRLHLRVDDPRAWRTFAAESGSHLVEKFNAMFVEGTRSGGEAETIGRMISNNCVRILNLRKHRRQAAGRFRSMLLGFMGGMAFTLYIGVGVLRILMELFSGAGSAQGYIALASPGAVNLPLMMLLVQATLVLHALLGSMMTQAVEGGSFLSGYVDFVVLLWMAVGISLVSEAVFAQLFTAG